ncbi:MAG: hypothetical protein QOE05_2412 [Actinomycetota bacterium]|nr:hypothetical protein [Actinomycetota bacterium]
MQTFLPYPDFRASCLVLDDRRLGKQRVETFQILRALTWPTYAWKNHPAVAMWRGFVPALVAYGLESCREWTRRGYADTVAPQLASWGTHASYDLPPWFGLDEMHRAHQSSLLRKDPAHYGPLFPGVPDDLPYYWPTPVFPRWPVRRESGPVDLDTALGLLGYATPRAGQAEAVTAAVAGRDHIVSMPPGSGASTAGLLAGLCTPGRTLWITPLQGPVAAKPPRLVPFDPVSVVTRAATASTAKQPAPADLLAMRAEHAPPAWVFRRPRQPVEGDFGLVVVDGANRLRSWTPPVDAPVLRLRRT